MRRAATASRRQSSRPDITPWRSARSATTSTARRAPTSRRAAAQARISSSRRRATSRRSSVTPVQKDALFNCVGCHTVERIVRSTHDADEFVQTMKRMSSYANQSLPVRPQKRKAERLLEERGDQRDELFDKRAEWLASINLSQGDTWEYPFKTLPRPKGRATQVVITEY